MVRKTVTIEEPLYMQLQTDGVMDHFKSFSELVSVALRNTLESFREDRYRQEMAAMADDPMVAADIEEIEADFLYADFGEKEWDAF